MHRLRVISNLRRLAEGGSGSCSVELIPYPRGKVGVRDKWGFFLKSFRCDYVVLNNRLPDLLVFAALKFLFPFHRCRLISVDTILGEAEGVLGPMKRWLRILLLKNVHRHFLYFKDVSGYSRAYRIKRERFRYVPFKINSYEQVIQTKTTDEGFIFTGGISRRDYTTFLKAVRDLPYLVKMIAGDPATLLEHGTCFDETLLTPRIELFTEYNPERYIEIMAASRLVVVPLRGDCLTPGGISAYPDAMALGKCLIISSTQIVRGVLTDDMVLAVPAGDPEALRAAIERAWNDPDLRSRISAGGRAWALKLGGEERFMKSIVEELLYDQCGGKSQGRLPETNCIASVEHLPDHERNSNQYTGGL